MGGASPLLIRPVLSSLRDDRRHPDGSAPRSMRTRRFVDDQDRLPVELVQQGWLSWFSLRYGGYLI